MSHKGLVNLHKKRAARQATYESTTYRNSVVEARKNRNA